LKEEAGAPFKEPTKESTSELPKSYFQETQLALSLQRSLFAELRGQAGKGG
jgi:hypothetical protein